MSQSDHANARCAHVACKCGVREGEAYCSEHCRKRVESPLSDQAKGCQCGHPACQESDTH